MSGLSFRRPLMGAGIRLALAALGAAALLVVPSSR
jgi:hypothetical protein